MRTEPVAVKDLNLDLDNYRTLPQKDEAQALQALIAIAPDYFWAVTKSLLDDGYLPTENVVVLEQGKKLLVREGNRRIGALKLALGHLKKAGIEVPDEIASRIEAVGRTWKLANAKVPCAIYEADEAELVDKIVSLTHGKGEKAGRLVWPAVARARHNRKPLSGGKGTNEPTLDFLESYLANGRNLTPEQRQRWAGEYPLSVLEEALKKIAKRLGLGTLREVIALYPGNTKRRAPLEKVALDIGLEQLRFSHLRGDDFGGEYGFENPAATSEARPATARPGGTTGDKKGQPEEERPDAGSGERKGRGATKAVSTTDPRGVTRRLKQFQPRGRNREKLVDLRDEAAAMNLGKTPLAFCFVLRAMFELSAKAYCTDHKSSGGPRPVDDDGNELKLADLLREVAKHLTKNNADREMERRLHGAMTELNNRHGLLSVTSMNQLIHNKDFTADEASICRKFNNVFPFLEEMSK